MTVAEGATGEGAERPSPVVFETTLATVADDRRLTDEVFGAAGLVVRYDDVDSLARALDGLEGQLTATLHGTSDDHDAARVLLPVLQGRAGRILWGGWPTGVEVAHAMVHGGPFPATSDGRSTSVGSLAIERFQRPVCYQDLPVELQPESVRDANPWDVPRSVDGLPART